jgi:subtilisin family serine protease
MLVSSPLALVAGRLVRRAAGTLCASALVAVVALVSAGSVRAQGAPSTPGNPSPGSTSSPGPTTSASTVSLSWNSSSGATYYDLGVRDMVTNQLVVDTQISGTSYAAGLSAGKPYRWNVAACNASGCSAFTTPRYFQTPASTPVPPTPGNPSPGSTGSPGPTTSGSTVSLSWNSSSGATFYDLGVRDMVTNQLVVDTQVSGTSYSANLSPGKPYRWNVAACNTSGCSSFTSHRYFQTPAALPSTPGNLSPGSTGSPGPTTSGSTVSLSWNSSSGATYYDLGVRDMVTNQLVVDTQVSGTSYSAGLSPGKPYRWNVAACNTAGCSSFTSHRYFQTPATGVPELLVEPLSLTFELAEAVAGRPSPAAGGPAPLEIDWEVVARLEDQVRAEGTVRVIVGLDVEAMPAELGSSGAAREFRIGAIGRAQQLTVAALEGTTSHVVATYSRLPLLALEVDRDALARLLALPSTLSIEPDQAHRPALASSGPVIGTPAAWALGYEGDGQAVAILDTGVHKSHPFFSGGSGAVVSEACYSTTGVHSTSLCPGGVQDSTAAGSAAPCPATIGDCAHGTHVAGIAAGNGGPTNDVGVAPGADIIAMQVFSRFDSSTYCGSSTPCVLSWSSDQIQGLNRVLELQETMAIAAVNLSLGSGQHQDPQACDAQNPGYKLAVDELRSFGIATVASTGNNGYRDSIGSPACISSVISVAATEDDDDVYVLSNIADFVDLVAPGVQIRSSVPGTGSATASMSGTSMAAPHVTGAWALLKQQNPAASVEAILGALRQSATSVDDDRSGGTVTDLRRINVDQALALSVQSDTFSITNVGTASATVTGITLDQPAAWISWAPEAPFALAPGASQQITVTVDASSAPSGSASRRLLIASTDPAANPYPGGVYVITNRPEPPPTCHSLTRTHSGSGSVPSASPSSSPGCSNGAYHAGATIELAADPSAGWMVGGWTGTNDDSSTAPTNTLTMPAGSHAVSVTYVPQSPEIFADGFESGDLSAWSGAIGN